jgi:hypothetical protein
VTDVDLALATNLIEFLGLTSAVDGSPERTLSFPLGVLYPYSGDLRRVYDQYIAVADEFPDAEPLLVGQPPGASFALREGDAASDALDRYMAAVDGLHDRTAFASRTTDAGVGRAQFSVRDAITRAKRRSVAA